MSKRKPQQSRKLKIAKRIIKRRWVKDAIYPEIRLSGLWLAQMGFAEGKHVQVEQEANKLVITLGS